MSFWAGKRVLLTGHTGFKGAWMALWLTELGADVTGFALPPETPFFDQLDLRERLTHVEGDLRDFAAVQACVQKAHPEITLHLAAQALVLRSYDDPVATWGTNVQGSVHVLEALRHLDGPRVALMVTTDKVYLNREWPHSYRETDRLGGHDPYSASKAAMELAVDSFRKSFGGDGLRIASARAGNVIGGGDWSENRMVPDIARALAAGETVNVRNPHAVRPWQHVLEPLAGYANLAERLWSDPDARWQDGFNFGPEAEGTKTVRDLVEESLRHWPGSWVDTSDPQARHEAGLLTLATDKARNMLGHAPRWSFAQTVGATMRWYRDIHEGADPRAVTLRQLQEFGLL